MGDLIIQTNRYLGLLRLKEMGIPVPEFYVIYATADLKNPYFESIAPYGWTIRTCKKNGINEISLFYKNRITLDELDTIITARLANFSDEFYIVYHSWDFLFSFNILKSSYEYVVEGEFGSQKNISLGKNSPKFRIRLDRMTGKQLYDGVLLEHNMKKYIYRAIKYIEEIHSFKNAQAYFEVAITKTGELFFYEYWDIQNLTPKY